MRLSFRTRLFVVATLIVGTALSGVIAAGWNRVMAYEVDRLDEQLCSEARRVAKLRIAREDPTRLWADVALKLRLNDAGQLLMGAQTADGEALLATPNPAPDPGQFDALAWRIQTQEPGPLADQAAGVAPRTGRRPRPADTCWLADLPWQETTWRAARVAQKGVTGWVAADLAAPEAEIKDALKDALSVVIPLALALTALGAWVLARYTIRPVNRLREAMRQMNTRALDQRLPSHDEDREFEELIAAYNTMLARLESSFHQASRFSADAAHELKTPLTILRGRLENALQRLGRHSQSQSLARGDRADPMDAHHALVDELAELLDEVGRLSAITRKLLLLSQADAGQLALSREPVDLSRLLHELRDDADMMAEGHTLDWDIPPGATVVADALLLRQALNNLLSNALRYSLPGSAIGLRLDLTPDWVSLTFSNPCQALSNADKARVFDRFFRADRAHSRRVDGTGLGLSLSREIARAHGGELALVDEPADENHFAIRLTLPRMPA
jgi:two-component system heavy metal sensor histidine kinase CusS